MTGSNINEITDVEPEYTDKGKRKMPSEYQPTSRIPPFSGLNAGEEDTRGCEDITRSVAHLSDEYGF